MYCDSKLCLKNSPKPYDVLFAVILGNLSAEDSAFLLEELTNHGMPAFLRWEKGYM